MRPSLSRQLTHDRKGNGTTLQSLTVTAATGEVIGKCHQRHRSLELKEFVVGPTQRVRRPVLRVQGQESV